MGMNENAATPNRFRTAAHGMLANGGKVAMAVALAATLAVGQAATPATALAENATFTITAKDNTSAVYKVVELFKADIVGTDGTEVTEFTDYSTTRYPGKVDNNIAWPNDATRNATVAFLNSNGYGAWLTSNGYDSSDANDPRMAGQFIAYKIGVSENINEVVPPTKAAGSFALELARTLAATSGVTTTSYNTASNNGVYTGEEGYYLFFTDDSSVGTDEAGTSPIWVPLGGNTSTLVEKTDVPTLTKKVKDDAPGSTWANAADANKNQDLEYQVTGTLPANLAAYDKYNYKIEDTLAGLDVDTSTIKLRLVDASNNEKVYTWAQLSAMAATAVDNSYGAGDAAKTNKIVVDIKDIKTIPDHGTVAINKDTTVYLEYKAKVNGDAVMGGAGNANDAVLKYTSNPVTDAVGTTTTTRTKTYTYGIDLEKVDKELSSSGAAVKLAGAKFTVQVASTSDDDAAVKGKYVGADGTLQATAYEFTTDADGKLTIPNVDAGTYILKETKAPDGYVLQKKDITVVIESTLNQDTMALTSLAATVSGGEPASGDLVATHQVGTPDTATGKVSVQTSDPKVVLPITGMDGTTLATTVAGGMLVLSLAGLYATRRRSEGAAQDE